MRVSKREVAIDVGGYLFFVNFVDFKTELDGNCDGRTFYNDRIIKIRDDIDETATELILRHEITHALLGTQGRVYQRKFDLEEVCEFIAYRLPEIQKIVEGVMNEITTYN